MSTVQKRQLKSAKEAIQAENYEYAQQLCKDILEEDPCNYTAMVFLGLSNSKMKLLNEAVYAYENAIKAYPNQPLAYQGLKKLYEDENNDAGILKVLEMQSNLIVDDPVKSLEYLEKRTEITRKIENPSKLVKILSSYLNNVSIAKLTPKLKLQSILKEIIDIKSAILESEITTSIGERRMRLDAESLPILTRKV